MVMRVVLGVVFVAMAAGQLASWTSMPDILDAYEALPAGALPWLAGVLIAAELTAGVWLVARPRSLALTPVWIYMAVAVAWTVLGVQAFVRDVPVSNCGCFGRYLTQRLSWFTLAQDALLVGYGLLMLRSGVRDRRRRVGLAAQPGSVGPSG
jgi:hypothetical protein